MTDRENRESKENREEDGAQEIPVRRFHPFPSYTSSSLSSLSSLIPRLFIGGVLFYSGFTKAVGPTMEFAAVIEAYKVVPPEAARWLALGLPYTEMWIGLFLLTGLFTRWAAAAAGLLFLVFLGALGSTLARGIDLVSCGCFGAAAASPPTTMAYDVLFLVLSSLVYRASPPPPRWSLDRLFIRS